MITINHLEQETHEMTRFRDYFRGEGEKKVLLLDYEY